MCPSLSFLHTRAYTVVGLENWFELEFLKHFFCKLLQFGDFFAQRRQKLQQSTTFGHIVALSIKLWRVPSSGYNEYYKEVLTRETKEGVL